ncbi:MAG: hypothetical protein BMS9Abin20_0354 [Acidimicrobiia bacterium]|nr:MAG: hypothetical protein BMS9Abin20_0354 [Acidimicrobiia bacterium]
MFDYSGVPAAAHAGEGRQEDTGVVAQLERISAPHERVVDSGVETDDVFSLAPGQIAGLSGLPGSGLTRVGLSLLTPYTSQGPLAYLDVRGWVSPLAAWELGIEPERFVVVRTADIVTWSRVVATLLDGVRAVYAEIPHGVRDAALRTLAARARTRRTPLVLRPLDGKLPQGVAHLQIEAREVAWEGTEQGHGRLLVRRTLLDVSGKATRGMERTIEVEDDGTNDLRVVSHLGTQTSRRFP